MKHLLLSAALLVATFSSNAQVGIGTTEPKAFFNVPAGRTVLFGNDTIGSYQTPAVRFDPRFIWYGAKGALRAGAANLGGAPFGPTNAWNIESVGNYSFASGAGTVASGQYSTAMGLATTASGDGALAAGYETKAYGNYSIALGYSTQANSVGSTALGKNILAVGEGSLAAGYNSGTLAPYAISLGRNNDAYGMSSVCIGTFSNTRGNYSVALGSQVHTYGERSVAIGTLVGTGDAGSGGTNPGSVIIGDASTVDTAIPVLNTTASNQFTTRFAGGYKFFTNATATVGVEILPGGNAWQTLSDSTRKENFRMADGTSFLKKISQMRLGSWNYKGQDPNQNRHYGPMAQDFYAAFGKDEMGTVGEEKSINQADFDGVNLIAIKALIEKVEKLEAENSKLRSHTSTLEEQNATLQKETASLKSDIDWIKKQLGGLAKQ